MRRIRHEGVAASRRAWPRRAIALACPHAIVISSRTRPSAAWRATCLPLKDSIQADFARGGRLVDRAEDDWRRMFATNLDGVFDVFQVVLRHMINRAENGDRFGRLIATSSLPALFCTARKEHYAAAKAAINALTRALAVEHARYGVTANAILPGWIETDIELVSSEQGLGSQPAPLKGKSLFFRLHSPFA